MSDAPEGPTSETVVSPPLNSWDRFLAFLENKAKSINIGHLLILISGLHLLAMFFPNQSGQYVFDEAYYVPSARDLLNLVPNNLEHPFFGKVWAALGIYIFKDNFFGWRIFYVIIGILSVWVLYELARVFFSKEKALFAASFFAFETLFFIHTSLALLEGPPILFGLLAFLAYFKKHYYLSAVAFALSVLSKEWGIYFVLAFFLYHVWATRSIPLRSFFGRVNLQKIIVFVIILVSVVSIPLFAYDQIYHPYTSQSTIVQTSVIVNPANGSRTTTNTTTTSYAYVDYPWQNFEYYYNYHTNLPISASDAQNTWDHFAWGWILPFNINPSGYYVTTVTVTSKSPNGTIIQTVTLHPIDWRGIGNLVIWYSFWIIIPVLIAKVIQRKFNAIDVFIGAWIAGTYIPSLYLSAVVHRVVYAFYFVNVDPALALGIPMVVSYITPDSPKLERLLLLVWLAAAIIFFILFFPIHPLDF